MRREQRIGDQNALGRGDISAGDVVVAQHVGSFVGTPRR
jgi:hypothetical protein